MGFLEWFVRKTAVSRFGKTIHFYSVNRTNLLKKYNQFNLETF